MLRSITTYNEVDILYTLITYVNYSSSPDMYYTIAQTILSHLDDMPHISINDLASMCYTSPATISRFCKDLNCGSFANFKKELQIALDLANDEIHLEEEDEKALNDNPSQIINKIYGETIDSLKEGMQSLDMNEIDQVCELIHDAPVIHMYAYQFSKLVCTDFQQKMLKLRKFVYAFADRGDGRQKLETIEEGELVIIVSVRARKKIMDSLVEKLKVRKPKLLLVTMNQDYTNEDIDYYLRVKGFESDYTQSAMMGTIDLNTLFNVIYVRYGLKYCNL